MKKIFFLAVAALACYGAFAQSVNFGLKGGLNLASWTNNNNGIGYQNRAGFHAGGLAQINLTPQFAIQPEVVYSSQGTKYMWGNQQHNLALNYVNIPLLLQAKLGQGFFAQAGPQIGFLTSVSDKVNAAETGFFEATDFKNTDAALVFGVGYEGRSGVGVDARYNLGLTNINNNGSSSIRNNVIQLGLFLNLSRAGNRR